MDLSLPGIFAPRSENAGERKVPEPCLLLYYYYAIIMSNVLFCTV